MTYLGNESEYILRIEHLVHAALWGDEDEDEPAETEEYLGSILGVIEEYRQDLEGKPQDPDVNTFRLIYSECEMLLDEAGVEQDNELSNRIDFLIREKNRLGEMLNANAR
jgi:hypothetical protein